MKNNKMKKLKDIEFEGWYIMQMSTPLIEIIDSKTLGYKVEKETERAIMIRIYTGNSKKDSLWTEWFPKSVILNLDKVLEK